MCVCQKYGFREGCSTVMMLVLTMKGKNALFTKSLSIWRYCEDNHLLCRVSLMLLSTEPGCNEAYFACARPQVDRGVGFAVGDCVFTTRLGTRDIAYARPFGVVYPHMRCLVAYQGSTIAACVVNFTGKPCIEAAAPSILPRSPVSKCGAN